MFSYKTYEEATKVKKSISRALLGVDKNVVCVSTEKEKIGDSLFYSVKIGLENGPNIEVLSNIFEHLKKANIVSESFEDMVSAQADCLSTFVEVGTILPFEHVSADDNLKSDFLTKFLNFFNFNQLKNQQHIRPVTPGFSVGHEKISAGTVGAILTDQNGIHHMLSNNHVLANTNQGKKGDKIIQPGFSDRGKEEVARLEYFFPIAMKCANNHTNKVDMAIATLSDQSKLNCAVPGIGEIDGSNIAHMGMKVEKSGRTTGHTLGIVESIDTDLTINYGEGQAAFFSNQIRTSVMSKPGDSGSVLINKNHNGRNEAVGLIFAGSLKNSFANHYSDVDAVLKSNNYNTRFAKSTVNSDPLPKLNFLYNRTLMRKSLALSTLVGTIGLAAYATSSVREIKPNPDNGKVSPKLR